MNPLAQELNRQIAAVNPHVLDMLSERGKRFYFPKGILSQSAEAKSLATKFNATIGTALEDGHAMALPSLMEELPGIDANSALLYAPSPGNPKLREAWRLKTLHDNPSLSGHPVSLPIVTNGLSHGLSLLADMFVNPGDPLIYPDMNWGNYALNFVTRAEAVPCYYKFFKDNGFNIDAFKEALVKYSEGHDKVIVLLNFPNNPSGYTPTEEEGDAIANALVELAEKGVNVVAIIDDAYFKRFNITLKKKTNVEFRARVRKSLWQPENTTYLRLLVLQALSNELITPAKAASLLGVEVDSIDPKNIFV